jgi:hypothetical protein
MDPEMDFARVPTYHFLPHEKWAQRRSEAKLAHRSRASSGFDEPRLRARQLLVALRFNGFLFVIACAVAAVVAFIMAAVTGAHGGPFANPPLIAKIAIGIGFGGPVLIGIVALVLTVTRFGQATALARRVRAAETDRPRIERPASPRLDESQ